MSEYDPNWVTRYRLTTNRDYKQYNDELYQPDHNVEIEFHADSVEAVCEQFARFLRAVGYDWVYDVKAFSEEENYDK